MLAFNRLRIDPGNGSPAVDYRIEDGFVESRTLETDSTKRSTLAIEKQWQRLTPEQLTSRLMDDTVLLRWLRHRMGVYRLIRACNQDSSSPNDPALESSNRAAARKPLSGETSITLKMPGAGILSKMAGHS